MKSDRRETPSSTLLWFITYVVITYVVHNCGNSHNAKIVCELFDQSNHANEKLNCPN